MNLASYTADARRGHPTFAPIDDPSAECLGGIMPPRPLRHSQSPERRLPRTIASPITPCTTPMTPCKMTYRGGPSGVICTDSCSTATGMHSTPRRKAITISQNADRHRRSNRQRSRPRRLRRDEPVHEQYGLKTYLLKEKPSSALLSATGRDYAEWFQLLHAWGAPGRGYREMADWLPACQLPTGSSPCMSLSANSSSMLRSSSSIVSILSPWMPAVRSRRRVRVSGAGMSMA